MKLNPSVASDGHAPVPMSASCDRALAARQRQLKLGAALFIEILATYNIVGVYHVSAQFFELKSMSR
jgi:hypothetical protein